MKAFVLLFQPDLLALAVKGGLIDSQDLGCFGQVSGSLQNFAQARFSNFSMSNFPGTTVLLFFKPIELAATPDRVGDGVLAICNERGGRDG